MAGEWTAAWLRPAPEAIPQEDSPSTFEAVGGWLTAIVLVLLLLNMGWAISAAAWTEGLEILTWVLLGGAIVGILLAVSRFDGFFPLLHSLVTGSAWVLYWVSTLLPGDLTAPQRAYEAAVRWYSWLALAIAGGASDDNLVFILEIALLGWWLAFLAGWAVFRERRVWRAVVPIGVAMIVNAYYAISGANGFLLVYFLLALLLLVRVNLSHYESWWRYAGIRYAPDIHLDFLRNGLIFSVIVVAIAWALPAMHSGYWLQRLLEPMQQPWEAVQEEWQRLFTSLNYRAAAPSTNFGKTLTLAGNREVGDRPIMQVQTARGERRYWRGAAYDTYTGRGWVNTDEEMIQIGPGVSLDLPVYELRRVVTQTITALTPEGNLLFAASMPIGASVAARADVSFLPSEWDEVGSPTASQQREAVDISRMLSRESLSAGSRYTTRSLITTVDKQALREAPTQYPEAIASRYLQLPETLPDRVRQLAVEVTAGAETVYDKAAALESYLRQEITYNDKIAPPPAGADGVDYFLFDVRAGYCDYYASAMAVMARALGIPARIASGYAEGTWDEEARAYQVRELDAHTWVEIYFPGYGWIEFEPTAAQPAIVRPERREEPRLPGELSSSNSAPPTPPPPSELPPAPLDQPWEDPVTPDLPRLSTWQVVSLAAALLALALLAVGWARQRARKRAVRLSVWLYEQLLRWAARVGIPLSPARTPYEEASVIAALVPEGGSQVMTIATAYVRDRYSSRPPSVPEQAQAERSWRILRRAFWKEWLLRCLRLGRSWR